MSRVEPDQTVNDRYTKIEERLAVSATLERELFLGLNSVDSIIMGLGSLSSLNMNAVPCNQYQISLVSSSVGAFSSPFVFAFL